MSSRAPDAQPKPDAAQTGEGIARGSFEESVRRLAAIVEQLDPKSRAHKRAIKNYSVLLEL